MKRFFGILTLLVVCITLFSCSKNVDEQIAEPLDKGEQIEQIPVFEEQKPIEQPPVKEQSKEPVRPAPTGDKAPWCTLTLDNTFSEYEVVVTLTLEESAKKLTYTADDFPKIDAYYAFKKNDYFSGDEYRDRTTLFLILTNPSKQNVLDAVRTLEDDPRVYAACPNAIIDISYNIEIYTTDSNKAYSLSDFSEIEGVTSFMQQNGTVYVSLPNHKISNVIKIINKLNRRQDIIRTDIQTDDYFDDCVVIMLTPEQSKIQREYSLEDFKEYNFDSISVDNKMLTNKVIIYAKLKQASHQSVTDLMTRLENDNRVYSVQRQIFTRIFND